MSSKAANHLHRYRKVNLSRRKGKEYWVFQCQKPSCSHYVPVHLALGRLCECNRCGEPMLIGKIQLNGSSGGPMAKPHCNNCIERTKTNETDLAALANFVEEKTSID